MSLNLCRPILRFSPSITCLYKKNACFSLSRVLLFFLFFSSSTIFWEKSIFRKIMHFLVRAWEKANDRDGSQMARSSESSGSRSKFFSNWYSNSALAPKLNFGVNRILVFGGAPRSNATLFFWHSRDPALAGLDNVESESNKATIVTSIAMYLPVNTLT